MTLKLMAQRRTVPAKGSATTSGALAVFVYLAPHVVAELRAQALKRGVSLSSRAREAIEWGLAAQNDTAP